MALTTTQQNKVLQILGFGGKTIQTGSVIYNKLINDRLSNLPTDTESLVISFLTQVAAIETQMNVAISRLTAEKVGDITLNPRELHDLRLERKKIAKEIAVHLDIPYLGASGSMSVCV